MKKLIKILDWCCFTIGLFNCACSIILYWTTYSNYIPVLFKVMSITTLILSIMCLSLFLISFLLTFIKDVVIKQDIKEKTQLDDIQTKLDLLLSEREKEKQQNGNGRKKAN